MDASRERKVLIALSVMQFAHILDFVIMMPLGPQFMRVFQIRPDQFGFLVSAYTLSASVAGLLSSFFVDSFDRKRVILVIFTAFVISTFLCAISGSYHQLLLARLVAGSFGGIMGALTLSIVGDLFPPERRGHATGILMSSFSIASVVGVPIGLFFASLLNWRVPFFAVAALGLVFVPYSWKALPPIKDHLNDPDREGKFAAFAGILSSGDSWRAFGFMFFLMITGFSVIPYLSPYLVKNAGMTEEQLPLIYFAGGIFTFFTSRYIGRLSDRFGKKTVFLYLAALATLPILMITHLPPWPLPVIIAITTVFMILMSGRVVPAMAMITGSVSPGRRGAFMSINASVQHLSTSLAATVGGLIVREAADGRMTHFTWVGYMAVASSLISMLMANRIQNRG